MRKCSRLFHALQNVSQYTVITCRGGQGMLSRYHMMYTIINILNITDMKSCYFCVLDTFLIFTVMREK